ncbi:MAG: imidazole glycerol phosphate synthase subunit HisH [Ardenticatenaceae bacterium]
MIVIIDYGMGNLGSIANMLKKVGVKGIISSDISVIEQADKLILPGVGAFDNGMKKLAELGMIDLLNAKVIQEKTPVLGLCLGMQLLTRKSEEGNLPGLGWLEGETIRFNFEANEQRLKVPHMGWNYIHVKQQSKLFADMPEESRFYFVHSYHLVGLDQQNVLATTFYGYEFPSIVMKENIMGAQFHPEKSHKFGLRLLKNFVEHF